MPVGWYEKGVQGQVTSAGMELFFSTCSRQPPVHVLSCVQESRYCSERSRSIVVNLPSIRSLLSAMAAAAKAQQAPQQPWSLMEVTQFCPLQFRQSRLFGSVSPSLLACRAGLAVFRISGSYFKFDLPLISAGLQSVMLFTAGSQSVISFSCSILPSQMALLSANSSAVAQVLLKAAAYYSKEGKTRSPRQVAIRKSTRISVNFIVFLFIRKPFLKFLFVSKQGTKVNNTDRKYNRKSKCLNLLNKQKHQPILTILHQDVCYRDDTKPNIILSERPTCKQKSRQCPKTAIKLHKFCNFFDVLYPGRRKQAKNLASTSRQERFFPKASSIVRVLPVYPGNNNDYRSILLSNCLQFSPVLISTILQSEEAVLNTQSINYQRSTDINKKPSRLQRATICSPFVVELVVLLLIGLSSVLLSMVELSSKGGQTGSTGGVGSTGSLLLPPELPSMI